jgi:hypothetical protein
MQCHCGRKAPRRRAESHALRIDRYNRRYRVGSITLNVGFAVTAALSTFVTTGLITIFITPFRPEEMSFREPHGRWRFRVSARPPHAPQVTISPPKVDDRNDRGKRARSWHSHHIQRAVRPR